MFDHWYTVIVMPRRRGREFQLRLPRGAFVLAAVLAVLYLLPGAWVLVQSVQLQQEAAGFDNLERRYWEQQVAARKLANEVERFRAQVADLRQLDYQLRVITDLGVERPSPSQYGIGGSMDGRGAPLPQRTAATDGSLLASAAEGLDGLEEIAQYQEESFNNLKTFLSTQRDLIQHSPHRWPVPGFVSSGYGDRLDPFTGLMTPHHGIDIVAPRGTVVKAPAKGIVTFAGVDPTLGNMLVIDHGYGVITRYGHNEALLVHEGQRVERGDSITLVGSSGQSTGPHLHYEIRINDIAIDPRKFLIK